MYIDALPACMSVHKSFWCPGRPEESKEGLFGGEEGRVRGGVGGGGGVVWKPAGRGGN